MESSSKKENRKRKITKSALKKALGIFRYVLPYKWKFALGFLFLMVTGATALVFPKLMGRMIDSSMKTGLDTINDIALTLLIIFFLQSIASYFRIYLFAYVTEKSLAGIRQDVYAHLITLPMTFFSSRRVGELNSRIAADISVLQETFTTTIAEFLRQIIIIVGGTLFLSAISLKLSGFMLALIPVLALAAVFFGRFIKRLSKETQNKVADSNTIVEETFQGISNVKAFTNEPFEISRYTNSTNEIIQIALRGAKWRGVFASFIIFCLFGSIVAVVWYGSTLVQAGEMTVGALIEFILYTVFMGASFGGIAAQYAQIQRAIGATENLMDLFEESQEPLNTNLNTPPTADINGNVEFQNVSFRYPTRSDVPVIENVSFTVYSGQQIAIVGPSGSGKSTLVSLLLRLYQPDNGTLLVDSKPATSYDLSQLRGAMAVVPQDVLLFGGSIRENIAYGKPNATNNEVIEAARKANALEFINGFPEKFETVVGERGIQLSGGQRQRIAIARAVLKDPAILILDEATSSLDSESERLVQEALDELMKGRTTFSIAHRLATIRNADRILVLDKGKIVESGTHQELAQITNGVYHQLSKLQFELT